MWRAGNLVLTTGLKRKLATIKGKKADVSSVRPSSELWRWWWHSGHNRHTTLLKRTQNNTHTLRNNSCSFSRNLVYGTRWTNLLSANLFPSLVMLRSYGPQRFWATNSTFPCDHQNQLDKPSLIYCVSFKQMQKSRQKFVMTQFVLWFCQENSGFVCYCR